jgi:hypothetical protein
MRFLAGLPLVAGLAFAQSFTPFTVIDVNRGFDAAGKVAWESRFLFAMNRDGSIASTDLDATTGATRQIIDVVKHRAVVVNPPSRSAAIVPYGGQPGSSGECAERFRHIAGAVVSVERLAGTTQGISLRWRF